MNLKAYIFFISLSLSLCTTAQNGGNKIDAIPFPLEVYNSPVNYTIGNNSIEITAKGKTNLFNSPGGTSSVQTAPMILFQPDEDFTLTAKVTGNLKAIYDVAALVVYQDKNTWAKFCYENSVKEKPTIVSVVTRTYSDDCNSLETGKAVYLAIVRKGKEFSFFYSIEEKDWTMIRSFHLDVDKKVKVGFASHGSRGDGFTAIFSDIKYKAEAIDDMRDL